jgi:hypothetical protein
LADDVEFRRRIYISADETSEARRKSTFERVKARAERNGESVVIAGNVSIIKGIESFSVEVSRMLVFHPMAHFFRSTFEATISLNAIMLIL